MIQVRVEGIEGWLFGTFVLMDSAPHVIAQTKDYSSARLLFASGQPMGIENPTTSKVLVIDQDGDLWRVRLAGGQIAFVDPLDFNIVS